MRWYLESSHYKKELGDLVLDRVFDYQSPSRYVPDDFGIRLTQGNIEAHLSKIRKDQEEWVDKHPEDVKKSNSFQDRL